jgi:hypothetical protein
MNAQISPMATVNGYALRLVENRNRPGVEEGEE